MSLVNELQESAESEYVLTVLRKAKRVAYKLDQHGIAEWIEHELNGYGEKDAVPNYRDVPVSLCFDTNGYIPMGYGQIAKGIMPVPGFDLDVKATVREPISKVHEWVQLLDSDADRGIYQQLNTEMQRHLKDTLKGDPEFLHRATFMYQLDGTSLRSISDRIKDQILDWSCRLEAAGVCGEGHTFSVKEKSSASSTIFQISGSNINQVSSMSDSSIASQSVEQNNSSGKQKRNFIEVHPIISSVVGFATVLLSWLGLHLQYGIWFFGF